ncbi:hypothetical protein [Acinetobacter baumannii]|uniref:hypothetical protein n=1 Tax=Acinetobacter baumannii TaxID=470 RepID=UPI000EA85F7E|nr:hypothetical protein [Acinetobacter baumannii]RKL59059.1 hypothetical protein CKN54_09885 [Acinetobacter baumannii]
MKPEQFIREFGEKKAREVVAACPEYYHYYHIVEGAYYTCPKAHRVAIKDLKRLVESVDLVDSLGGLKAARSEAHKDCFVYNQPLLAAIAAYESIYGGGDES